MPQQTNITAVEWLVEQLNIWQTIADDNTNATLDTVRKLFEQAKQMEKEQIMMAVKDSWYMAKGSNFQEPQEEQYYNETYGSSTPELRYKDGSPMRKYNSPKLQELEQINQDNPITKGSTALLKVTSSKTEISDEEIKYAAYRDTSLNIRMEPEGAFIDGAKWYKEQLKNK